MEEDVLSEEENKAIETLKDFNEAIKYKSCISIPYNTKLFDTILNLIEKQQKEIEKLKKENKVYTELLKQNENRTKIKTCMTHNLPDNAEIICMIREDFERNFGNDYVSKDKIREFKNKFIKDSKNEKVFMTQSSQINASLIQFCNELLEERN